MNLAPTIRRRESSCYLLFDVNLSDSVVVVGLITITITFSIFFSLHSPGELEREEGFRQVPTISLTGCFSPANFIFTGGMHLVSVLLFLLFNAVYLIYESKIRHMYSANKSRMNSDVYQSSLLWNQILWCLGMFSVLLLCVTASVPVTVAGDVHSPAAFFFFFCFILHVHIFYFKVAHRGLLVKGVALLQLHVATFCSMALPLVLLVLSEFFLMGRDHSIFTQIAVNIHVVVEYIVTAALAIYIHSFRYDLSNLALQVTYSCSGNELHSIEDGVNSIENNENNDEELTSPLLESSQASCDLIEN